MLQLLLKAGVGITCVSSGFRSVVPPPQPAKGSWTNAGCHVPHRYKAHRVDMRCFALEIRMWTKIFLRDSLLPPEKYRSPRGRCPGQVVRLWAGCGKAPSVVLTGCCCPVTCSASRSPTDRALACMPPPTSRFRALISVPGRMSQGSPPTHKRSTRSCPSSSTWAETLERGSPSGEPGACGVQDAHTGGETEAGG